MMIASDGGGYDDDSVSDGGGYDDDSDRWCWL